VSFGSQDIGTSSSKTIHVPNAQNVPLSITSIQTTGDFSETNTRSRVPSHPQQSEYLESTAQKIDYFATSLPAMLLFEVDLVRRNKHHALFLRSQAQWLSAI
jgi:hypothetical protein